MKNPGQVREIQPCCLEGLHIQISAPSFTTPLQLRNAFIFIYTPVQSRCFLPGPAGILEALRRIMSAILSGTGRWLVGGLVGQGRVASWLLSVLRLMLRGLSAVARL